MLWETQATDLLSEDGTITGVRCLTNEGKLLEIRASAVILATGGFIQNKKMVAQYFGGAKVLGPGNKYCDGSGILMAQSVGGQMGKNFSVAINESGGANEKATPPYPLASPGYTYNNLFSFPLFGSLCVNRYGSRFLNEELLAVQMMFTAEPINRESTYYCIIDDALMQRLRTEPVTDILDPIMFAGLVDVVKATFEGKVWDDIDDDFAEAMEQGWAWKADTIEALAEQVGMTDLPSAVETYNSYCASGKDDEMFKDARFLTAIAQSPFYCVNMEVSAWMTVGGIKCDQNCQALDKDGTRIPGLYVAGGDADLWATPYYQGGTCCGFGNASGLIAGEAAADTL